jgi:hypothetical protein
MAEGLLAEAAASLMTDQAAQPAPPVVPSRWRGFADPSALPGPGYYSRALHEVHKLQMVLDKNPLAGDVEAADLLADWLNVDPTRPDAAAEYDRLADENAGSPLVDNLRLAAALAQRDALEKAKKLLPLANAQVPTDATAQAAFELSLIHAEGVEDLEGMRGEEAYLKDVIAAPANPWQGPAAERLRLLRLTREISP